LNEYLTVEELSAYVKRSPGAIRNLVLRRKIPFRKPSGRLLFDRQEIDKWVQGSPGISLKEMNNDGQE
jgi:excisionase family DNA binding protein